MWREKIGASDSQCADMNLHPLIGGRLLLNIKN